MPSTITNYILATFLEKWHKSRHAGLRVRQCSPPSLVPPMRQQLQHGGTGHSGVFRSVADTTTGRQKSIYSIIHSFDF
ncbi:MAG TPA: hypothetical protein DDW92_00605 [Candidatus Veblenbacteria bacterium]|uniref:Uncharacterized protein n=1 Tax=Candidatus Veblenbacteria bacterium RIFOXYA2_FULL_43_9 TaxID=1802425 RepID=A0A1G2Q169_9BACT|nr:MAG: hypothetical protein UV47_C0042G0005 [Parcubacteria group bacterium GW2011_GWA2_42_80]KKS91969.1 MAG: hypothetical protein UV69_C0041G0006 [Parcubacteria group bacterium GW2011_GWE2_43_12]OHA54313.1 MAG: hypothetical protein A2226_02615 [Candidatus Veblenbacteria bacterium RIFOXYA2_FULL_43_9]HBH16755.1 hypothetical protein [Candidatus Veblenbacteria bacterium]HBZ36698.1 hypothetical protein [Candidatus Veblenbacteria bacterium]